MNYLDITDKLRRTDYAEATCSDCDYYLRGCACEAEEHILAGIITDLFESNPDAHIPGLRVMPEGDDPASRCPGFFPCFEYIEEVAMREKEERDTWCEDFGRMAGMGRGVEL